MIVVASVVAPATTLVVRERPRTLAGDVMLATGGAGLAVGGLMLLTDVSPVAWIVAPVVSGAATVLHVRALFATGGPFRI